MHFAALIAFFIVAFGITRIDQETVGRVSPTIGGAITRAIKRLVRREGDRDSDGDSEGECDTDHFGTREPDLIGRQGYGFYVDDPDVPGLTHIEWVKKTNVRRDEDPYVEPIVPMPRLAPTPLKTWIIESRRNGATFTEICKQGAQQFGKSESTVGRLYSDCKREAESRGETW
jgi:hypothetical protein